MMTTTIAALTIAMMIMAGGGGRAAIAAAAIDEPRGTAGAGGGPGDPEAPTAGGIVIAASLGMAQLGNNTHPPILPPEYHIPRDALDQWLSVRWCVRYVPRAGSVTYFRL